ncbi:MAG TPA: hypothetical protein H9867_05245 [Candidatus Corynebacterium gallistercoris]|uniref:CopG family transcriptional regulator n=1 Tax=Candidatus Corynebacterium gallistercoris TaxID=2838530 RepID=A0A9D1RYD0_9CORY|nr:hypothetical protein [Candidatus Corynebacterium gallistercoris]
MSMTLRLSEADDKMLTQLASTARLSKQQYLIRMIEAQWAEHERKRAITEGLDAIGAERAELFERLRNA